MTIPIQFSIAISRGDDQGDYEASIGWRELCRICIRDTRLEELELLMGNKALRGEGDALRYNAQRYIEIVDEITEEILEDAMFTIRIKLSQLMVVANGAIAVTMIAGFQPVTLLVTLASVFVPYAWWAACRCRAIEEFLKARREGFDDRVSQLCASWMSHHV